MSKPIAVISGDIHYSLANLELADAGTRMAIAKANKLGVPFIANGDTSDTKAILRAECVNALIETFKTAKIKPYLNIGNHCRISTKGKDHALNFLAPYATVINSPEYFPDIQSYIIPYEDDISALRSYLKTIPQGSRVILHQGLSGSNMGEYVQDRSALNPEDLKDFRSILSHYHSRQDIKCGRPRAGAVGLASYIGNLYSVSFGESNDGPKGFQILMDDGTLEFIPTNLRKHVVYALDAGAAEVWQPLHSDTDLVWVKMKGTKERLAGVTKAKVAYTMGIKQDFRLDLIPTDNESRTDNIPQTSSMAEVLDQLIDSLSASSIEQKNRMKALWKELK